MKKIFLYIILSAIFATEATVAHPIDDMENRCIEQTNGETQKMNDCSKKAQKAWNKELEKKLLELSAVLDTKTYKSLLKSQKLWKRYYLSEVKTKSKILKHSDGTMFYNVNCGIQTQLIKNRVEILDVYKGVLEF